MIYLNSFRPLCSTPSGRAAITEYGLPPFIDGSIRRDPDFELEFTSVTALCRKGKFAPKLCVGDRIVYLTCKGMYVGPAERHRRLVSVLQVCHKLDSHVAAQEWYEEHGQPVPSNCMVEGNLPRPYDQSSQQFPSHAAWDREYRTRASNDPVFLVCVPLFKGLGTPPVVTDQDLFSVFGRIPGTQHAPNITVTEYDDLIALAVKSPSRAL